MRGEPEIRFAGPDRMPLAVNSEHDDTLSADGSAPDHPSVGVLAPGDLFAGRYEVQALLGRGGMGAVHRVRDRKLDEIVALKLLTLSTERAIERFQREVRLARRVTHPNVARTHDLGEHDGLHFLTMEYVPGVDLDRLLSTHERLPPERAAHIGAEIAAGLEAAHAAGVVHRDLKPANVLIGDDERVVLTDFGIARAIHLGARTSETGGLVGTPDYMAPEQVTGKPVDARCDLYALGLILFELLTGRLPFEAESPLAALVLRVQQPPVDPRQFAPVPDPLAELILRCLERDVERRPASASEIRAALAPASFSRSISLATPSGSWFAPLSPGPRALAVLPFVYRGDADHDYLGEGMAEELIDVLSRTKGLRVLALGATRRFAESRDPSRIGEELGADTVVDGTVQFAGERVRIAARLLDTDSGVQRWSARFDGQFADVFALQESMGRRVAESLRVEIGAAAHRHTAPQEAIELYLRARKDIRQDLVGHIGETLGMLDRCLELAPGLLPAYPAHAMAALRAWWRTGRDVGQQRGQLARESVARACQLAPELAETHLVRAMLSVQSGEYREASQALAKALEIAPTMAEAHQYLAELQVEAGRLTEAKRRIALALELDPSLLACNFTLARVAALEGDIDLALAYLRQLEENVAEPTMGVHVAGMRYALWRGDREGVRAVAEHFERLGTEAGERMALIGKVALGELPSESMAPVLEEIPRWLGNPRFTSLLLQVATETLAAAGAHAMALEALRRAGEGVLVDIEWMRSCPLLVPLRTSPVYAATQSVVARRASAIWR